MEKNLKQGECQLLCEICQESGLTIEAEYCDSVPDARIPGRSHSEPGYRLKALCWVHAFERKQVATSRVEQIVRCEIQGVGRLDRNRCGGDVVCLDCGQKYYDHANEVEYKSLHVLCDGSVVKL